MVQAGPAGCTIQYVAFNRTGYSSRCEVTDPPSVACLETEDENLIYDERNDCGILHIFPPH